MVRHALEQHDEVVMPMADDRGSVQHMNISGFGQQVRGLGRLPSPSGPGPRWSRRKCRPVRQQEGVLVRDDDLSTRSPLQPRPLQARQRRAPMDQHVAVDVDVFVGVGVAASGSLPRPAARRMKGS